MISLYIPGKSYLHVLPAGFKLLFLGIVSIFLLPVENLLILLICLICVIILYISLGRQTLSQIKLLIPLAPFLLIILGLHIWSGSLNEGISVIIRIVAMILLANLISLTTAMMDMMLALRPIFKPLESLGLSYKTLALSVALMIRFVPVLFAIYGDLVQSYTARSNKNPRWHLFAPFTLLSLKMAENVGAALHARGGVGVTEVNRQIMRNTQKNE